MIGGYRRNSAAPHQVGAAGLVLLGALGGWLGGCATRAQDDAQVDPAAAGAMAPADLPSGAIRVGRDLYQVPIGTDADGCRMYRLYSPTLLVTQAISYRARDGRFTIDKRAADCDSDPSADHSSTSAVNHQRTSNEARHGGRSQTFASRR